MKDGSIKGGGGTNVLLLTNQKKLISTLDHSRKKPTLKHTQSAQENTIQVNKAPERHQAVQNNNFTRASMPHRYFATCMKCGHEADALLPDDTSGERRGDV